MCSGILVKLRVLENLEYGINTGIMQQSISSKIPFCELEDFTLSFTSPSNDVFDLFWFMSE